jgi:transposase
MVKRMKSALHIEAIWLALAPMDMRAGVNTALARVVETFGAIHPHHAYCFANARAHRMKVLVHDGIGVWWAARQLYQGRFVWPSQHDAPHALITAEQFHALILGLPWQRIQNGIITQI